ncbi:MAG TPA: hypothetical protein VNJ01_16495 [Bacteriovoracaceae bacterium]|nr:hypothetical protein [Bacteriovoracaceae bacterium]
MTKFFILLLCLPLNSYASFLFNYGLNYTSEKDSSSTGEYDTSRTFHNLFLGASVNGKKTLFFGWNINSWASSLQQGSAPENSYSMTEMGPKIHWFISDNYNVYLSAEWNPYAKGTRDKVGTSRDISGSSIGVGAGYRFKLSRLVGLGAGLHYHSLSIKEEKVGSTEQDVSDGVTNIMPMLELSILTR